MTSAIVTYGRRVGSPLMPGISPARSGPSEGWLTLRGTASPPSRSILGARLRSRVPQYGHSVMYGLTSLPQFLQTTFRSGICAMASTILGPGAHVLSITSDAIRSSGLVAPRPSDFQSVNLHVRHARFTARVVQVRGAETTLAVSRGLPAAARPLPAEAEM